MARFLLDPDSKNKQSLAVDLSGGYDSRSPPSRQCQGKGFLLISARHQRPQSEHQDNQDIVGKQQQPRRIEQARATTESTHRSSHDPQTDQRQPHQDGAAQQGRGPQNLAAANSHCCHGECSPNFKPPQMSD